MKKNLLAVLLCVTVAAAVFAAGTSERDVKKQNEKKETLLLWLPPFASGDSLDMEFWTAVLKPWAEQNNCNLAIEITPWGGYEEKYLTGFASGEGPDVGYMYLEMFNDFIEMGTLADIEPYFTQKEKDNFIYWKQGKIKGGQYALPFVVGNPRIPYFNTDILKKAGWDKLPRTWEELIQCTLDIKKLNLPDVMPIAMEWADPAIGALNNIFYPYLWQAGGEIYNNEGTRVALLDNDAAVKAARFLYDLRFKYDVLPKESLALDGKSVRDLFVQGKVAIASMDANSAATLKQSNINWTYLPSFQNKTKAIWVASDALIMNNASKNKELAASLMKFITSKDTMTAFHTEISAFPSITFDEGYNADPIFKPLFDNESQYFRTLPVAEGAFKVMDNLLKNLQLMMLGDLTPEKAIANTVDYSKSVISK
ncbi:sugar ABC transporter substrate-binding protein [Treponema sp. HNW]|uniref:ABC transporter substrate-binding protein n=1 Tax=Treponema sp. HNW TaxID=3116654 RepID=UPI003D0A8374